MKKKVYSGHYVDICIMEYSRWNSAFDVRVKRLDLLHPVVSGNKLFKLKYNIENAKAKGFRKVVTFGGAWSNHLHASAYALKEAGLEMIALVRGEAPREQSAMLEDIRRQGAEVRFISRLLYAEKETEEFKMWLIEEFGEVYILPEGGANFWGINGCMEILTKEDIGFSDIVCSAGTGTMAAGLALSLAAHQRLHVMSALKGGGMKEEILRKLTYFLMDEDAAEEQMQNVEVYEDFHRGGYAKVDEELRNFVSSSPIPWDYVYTSKMMLGLEHLLKSGVFSKEAKILAIHSGGLQGNRGYET